MTQNENRTIRNGLTMRRARAARRRGATFLRQEKSSAKECFPQGRASRASAADFGELQLNKNRCFEFAEPRALQAPLASPPLSCGRQKVLAALSLRRLPPEFDQRNGKWVETHNPHKLNAINGSARDESLAAFPGGVERAKALRRVSHSVSREREGQVPRCGG